MDRSAYVGGSAAKIWTRKPPLASQGLEVDMRRCLSAVGGQQRRCVPALLADMARNTTGTGGKIKVMYRFQRENELTFDSYGAHSMHAATVVGVENTVCC